MVVNATTATATQI